MLPETPAKEALITHVPNDKPDKSLTSTIRVIGGKRAVIPCKSHEPLPKNMMFDCMKEINKARVKAPARSAMF